MMIRFADPYLLFLLLLLPLAVWYRLRGRAGRPATLTYSNLGYIKKAGISASQRPLFILFSLRLAVLALLIIALARPQSGVKEEEVSTRGIDIILALDVSTSMRAEDIKPNRLEAAKQVAAEFIKARESDRIGMVVFAAQGYTQCPLTLDYSVLLSFLDEIETGMIEDGTAIGMGLATAINRLRSSKAESKIIIALTDGRNNRGEIDPLTAAQAAQALGIRIYTIGAGTRGQAMYPVQDPFFGKRYVPVKVDIDETSLKKIADITGGRYFRATDRQSLESIYKEINSLEKTEIKVKEYTRYSELFFYLAGLAALLLLLEILLDRTLFRRIP